MTTFTRAELAARVMHDLGLLGAEESPSSADLEHAEQTCSSEIDLMAAKGIGVWNGSEDSIPNEYLTVLSRRICLALAPSFGLTSVVDATAAIIALERDLRILAAKPATGADVEATYY